MEAVLLDAGTEFTWDRSRLLSHWSHPTIAAALYLAACAVHNRRRSRSSPKSSTEPVAPSPLLDAASVLHNAALVAFSALVFCVATHHFLALVNHSGLADFLCPPPPPPPPPLAGRLHFWCYLFYLSKYWELVDTLLLMLRGKRIILLHAVHHAFIPLVMVILFDGRVAVSLVGLTVLNSLVHVVMYAYFLANALGYAPPTAWKKQVTRLQIVQFTAGVLGGSWYWFNFFRDVKFVSAADALFGVTVTYTEGCAGGAPRTVLVGYVMNSLLLALFVRFYVHAYAKKPKHS